MPESVKTCFVLVEEAANPATGAEGESQHNVMLNITRQSMQFVEQARTCSQVDDLRREPAQDADPPDVELAMPPQAAAELEQQNHALRAAISQLETDIRRLRRNLAAEQQIPPWVKKSIDQIELKAAMLANAPCDPASAVRMDLTAREEAVFTLASQALSNKVIGRRLGISGATVNSHLRSIYRKLGISDRATLVIMAKKGGQPRH